MINLENVSVGYSKKNKHNIVLKDISVELETGKLTCFLGRNGAGKSTIIKTILGVIPPIKGVISLNGKPLNEIPVMQLATKISAVLTDNIRVQHISVYEYVALGRIPYTNWRGNLSETDTFKVDEAIAIAEVEELKDKMITELSDGQMQKVNIARAISQDTEIILLDEPTAHLDVSNKFMVFDILRKLTINHAKTILVITHDLELAFQNADQLWVVDENGETRSGVAEDLLLDKKVIDSFITPGFDFDYTSGKFIYKREANMYFKLQGKEELKYWTKQALLKNGFGVNDNSENMIVIEMQNDIRLFKVYIKGELKKEILSIKDLIIYLLD